MGFQICMNPDVDVFSKLTPDMYNEARKVCIKSILHTDNTHHFEMVKLIETIYEMNTEDCERQAAEIGPYVADNSQLRETSTPIGDAGYMENVLKKKDPIVYLQLFLHFADVSNPLRPFDITSYWAHKCLDEFFDQGDDEKRLGLPIGMLNDRNKINRPGSQHGFIQFLVAPLVFASVRIFPSLYPLSSQLVLNLKEWRDVSEGQIEPEALAKRDQDIDQMREKAQALVKRCDDITIGKARSGALGNGDKQKTKVNLAVPGGAP